MPRRPSAAPASDQRVHASAYAALPSVERALGAAESALLESWSRTSLAAAVRAHLDVLRRRIAAGDAPSAEDCLPETVVQAARQRLEKDAAPRLRRVVNATGVVLHTNLGRALLAPQAVEAVVAAARANSNLEFDIDAGDRGDRDALVEEHLCALTGAEAATVVNNNAAAVVLALNSLAEGREVIVSRGELVEIGGSFRLPDIMVRSGVRLREVGTTNRTRLADYRSALGADTALLLKVHASNYRLVGFTESVEVEDLAALAATAHGVFVVEDLGAGAMVDLAALGLPPEPMVADRIRAGADLVLASGDKLLGGPQCGIVVGKAELVERLKRNPLKRALRCDKMTLAALEATLRLYRFAPSPAEAVPTLRYLLRPVEELRDVGQRAVEALRAHFAEPSADGQGFSFELAPSVARAGSGSQPDATIVSLAVAVRSSRESASAIARRFRLADPPIVGRIEKDVFLLDLRCIDDPADLLPGTEPLREDPRHR